MKEFDIIKFKEYIDKQVDTYITDSLNNLEKLNPGWIKKVESDLTNTDGTIKELSKEETEQKVRSIVDKISVPQFNETLVEELFIIDKTKLNEFIREY